LRGRWWAGADKYGETLAGLKVFSLILFNNLILLSDCGIRGFLAANSWGLGSE
jgi:hypothetical protein